MAAYSTAGYGLGQRLWPYLAHRVSNKYAFLVLFARLRFRLAAMYGLEVRGEEDALQHP
jgi:hypothetical protein